MYIQAANVYAAAHISLIIYDRVSNDNVQPQMPTYPAVIPQHRVRCCSHTSVPLTQRIAKVIHYY